MVHGLIHSNLGFYVGDLCYAMNEKLYDKFWGDELGFSDGVFLVPENKYFPSGKGYFFAVDSTTYGDGTYEDDDGREYPVDAGVIGVLPLELVDNSVYDGGGHIFEVPGVCSFTAYSGHFTIELPNHEVLIIKTDDEEEF